MGIGSISISLHEVFKLLHYANIDRNNLEFIRFGTSGGLGIEPGTLCFTESVLNEKLGDFVGMGQKRNDRKFRKKIINLIFPSNHLNPLLRLHPKKLSQSSLDMLNLLNQLTILIPQLLHLHLKLVHMPVQRLNS